MTVLPRDGAATERALSIVVVSKDEPLLARTLDALASEAEACEQATGLRVEVVVVDASLGRLEGVETAHPRVHWIDFVPPEAVRVSIAHQRNLGVRTAQGAIVVFLDAGCTPASNWLCTLLGPILAGEEVMVCGATGATGTVDPHRWGRARLARQRYLPECPTSNLAVSRAVFETVGGFDERFEYGSDIDFSWRAVAKGVRIRYLPEAVVLHDWGTRWRQLRRAYGSGKGRARLYAKHVLGSGPESVHKRDLAEHDVVPLVYPLYLLALPLAGRHRAYLALLLLPLWRARHTAPVLTLADHLAQGAGVLVGAAGLTLEAATRRPRPRGRTPLPATASTCGQSAPGEGEGGRHG